MNDGGRPLHTGIPRIGYGTADRLWDEHHDGICSTIGQNGHLIKNNIVVGNVAYSFYGITNLSTNIVSTGATIDYNLFYNSGQDPNLCQWLSRNTFPFTWAQRIAVGLDAHSVVADPMFTNPTAGDYSVKDGSPAITCSPRLASGAHNERNPTSD